MLSPGPANYRVIYRTGGTAVWEWRPILNKLSYEAAVSYVASIAREGRFSVVVSVEEFEKNGLPVSYLADEYFAS